MKTRPSTKVLIYNGAFTSAESCSDLKKLFTEQDIVSRPDVIESDFRVIDGLTKANNPVFVVPGGNFTYMGIEGLQPALKRIDATLAPFYNYVGICAGGYTATSATEIFSVTPEDELPQYLCSTAPSDSVNAGLVPEFISTGPFLKKSAPHCVKLSFKNLEEKETPYLYMEGPGFVPSGTGETGSCEVIATYNHYPRFFYPGSPPKEHKELAAMVRRKRTQQRGGIFLSGPHIEATVRDSQLLRLFKPESKEAKEETLPAESYKQLEESREKSLATVTALLRDTLNGDSPAVPGTCCTIL